MKRKEIIYKGLQNTPVYIEDTTLDSPDYFQITEFPAQFTAGKNAFKFKGNPAVFEYGSDLQIEIIDFNGEPIYYEVVDYLTDDGSIIISVYVYEDTPSGACTVTLIGQSNNVPEEWQGRPNIKWTRISTVNAMSPNITEIVFDVLPDVTISEQVGAHLDRVYTNGQFPTYTSGTVKYSSLNETPALELTGGKFTADMVGGTITITSPQNPTPTPDYTLSTTAYTTTIKKILSDSLALLDTEYRVLHSASMTIHTYKNFDASTYSISYEAKPTYVATQNSESYAIIEIKGLQPATGDVSRIKTFMNNNGTVGTWELINDIELTETDVFVASTSSLYPDQNIGIFTSQSVIDTYWEGHTYVGKVEKTAPTLTWTTASINNAMLVSSTTDISSSDAVYVTQIKSTYAAAFVGNGDYKVTIDAIGTSTNGILPKLSVYLSGSAFNFDSTDIFNQTLPVILGRRVGEIELTSNNQRLEDYVFNFQADRTGTATLLLVVENGTWQFSDVRTTTDNDTGYTPNYTRIRSLVPTAHKSSNQLSFKTEYYNVAGERSKQISYINDKSWTGGNRYIDGDYSMITGSLYVADALGSGIAITGQKNTGYVRSLGYAGFDANTPGFLIWSGSALPGATSKGVAYSGVGIELYATTSSYLRYSTRDSELDVRTSKFFLGSSTQYISGSNGNIAISSSNFYLDPYGNVTMSGSINAVAGAIGSIDLNGTAGSINGGAAFIDTFNGDVLDTNLWYDNSSNAGEKTVIVNGALRLQNDDAAWDYAIIGRKSFNRTNKPAFVWHFKILETSTSLPNQPRMMVGVTNKTGSSNYGDNVHAVYFSQNSILVYEGFTNIGTISSNTVAVGDTYRIELYPKSPASASYIIYKNENYTTPFLSASFGVNNSASLYPGIWTLPTSSTMEFYSVYAYDSTTPGAFDIKGGGSFGFVNNSGSKMLFTQGGFALASNNVGINGTSVRIGDGFKYDGSNLTISGSSTRILTPTFFLGGTSQYVSGSNGSLEISSSNFSLDRNGNVTITGTINATDGDIGGFAITQDAITGSGFYLSGSATSTGFFISSSKFNVKGNGDVTGSNVLFSGGKIGGVNIASSKLYTGTGTWGNANTGFYIDSFGSMSLEDNFKWDGTALSISGSKVALSAGTFFLGGTSQYVSGSNGNIAISSSNFFLTPAGNVTMSGNITANGGRIGGFTITSTQLSASGFIVDSAGTLTLGPATTFSTGDGIFLSKANTNNFRAGDATGSRVQFTGTDLEIYNASNVKLVSIGNNSSIAGFTLSNNSFTGSGFYISGSATGNGFFISSSKFNVKANGDVTGSGVLFSGGKIGGINIASSKLYTGTGTWGNSNTGFYVDSAGSMSLEDNFRWDGNALSISGSKVSLLASSFFLGGTSQYISGSNGNITINSTNFDLDINGNVTASNAEFRGANYADYYNFRVVDVGTNNLSTFTVSAQTYYALNLTGSYDPAVNGNGPGMFIRISSSLAYPIGAINIHSNGFTDYQKYGSFVIIEVGGASPVYLKKFSSVVISTTNNSPDAAISSDSDDLVYKGFQTYTVGATSYTDIMKLNTGNRVFLAQSRIDWKIQALSSFDTINAQYPNGITVAAATGPAINVSSTTGSAITIAAATTVTQDPQKNYISLGTSNSSQIYDDGNLHIHTRNNGDSIWLNTNNGQINLIAQVPSAGAVNSGSGVAIGSATLTGYVSINNSKNYTTGASYGYLINTGTPTGQYTGGSQTLPISLYAVGRIWGQEIDAFSDERMKDIHGEIELKDGIRLVNELKPIKYTWKAGSDQGLKSGYSAQQVSKAGFDHLISLVPKEGLEETVDADGFVSPKDTQFSMNYDQVTPYHGVVIKHLLERIEQLEETVKRLSQ